MKCGFSNSIMLSFCIFRHAPGVGILGSKTRVVNINPRSVESMRKAPSGTVILARQVLQLSQQPKKQRKRKSRETLAQA